MSHNKQQSHGFTLIELMLAMTFLSFILVFMALTLTQMLRTYDKGLTVKQINQAGRTVIDDIARSMRGEQTGRIVATTATDGRLCIGDIMYIWNPVYKGAKTSATPNQNPDQYKFTSPAVPITMARLKLTNPTSDCAVPVGAINQNQDNYTLLGDRARVTWADATPSADGRLIKLTLVLGTYDITEQTNIRNSAYTNVFNTPTLVSGDAACKGGTDGNYCAFSEFSTIVYLPNGE